MRARRWVLRLALVPCLVDLVKVVVAELEVLLGVSRMCALEVWWVVRGWRGCTLWRLGSGFVLLSTLSVSLEVAGSVRSAGTVLCP